jgi:hypothetical protein
MGMEAADLMALLSACEWGVLLDSE